MASGVTLEDPATTYIDPDVEIGADTIIHPGVTIEDGTVVGLACEIHSGARIVNSRLGDRVTVLNHCVIANSEIENDVSIGPFAHLRNHVSVGAHAKVGNFVEMKNTTFGEGSKSGHLAYLGDAVIGKNVNIGAGTITCNFDGKRKHVTTIEDGAFIGQRLTINRAGHRRRTGVRRHRHHRARRRSLRCAGSQRREAAQHRRMGRQEKGGTDGS